MRLASAYASTLRKGSTVTTSRDVSRAARTLKRAVQSALNASAINVVDLEVQPLPVARFETARDHYSGGVALRTTPGDPQSVDIIFLDEHGAELSQADRRKLERVFSRQEFRRAFPGEIAELSYPPRVVESYTHELLAVHRHERRPRGRPEGGGGLRGRDRVAGAAQPARHDRGRGAHPEQPAGRDLAHRDHRAAARRAAAAGRRGVLVPGRVRRQVRPGGRADPARGREGRAGQRGPGPAGRARPGRGRTQAGPRRAPGDHHPAWPSRSAGSTASRWSGRRPRCTR